MGTNHTQLVIMTGTSAEIEGRCSTLGESDDFYKELAETRRILSGAQCCSEGHARLSDRYCTAADIEAADDAERRRAAAGLRAPEPEL